MKKQFFKLASSLVFFIPSVIFSQQKAIQPCNTYAVMEEHFAKNKQYKIDYDKAQEKLQAEYLDLLNLKNQSKTAAVQYTVPVIFHILHTGGSENISDAQCISALAQINSDYAATGSDFSTIFAPFQALYVNSDIKFMLAKKDPSGNCTSGINHIFTTKTDWSQSNTSNYTGITWNPTKYLNIIIVKQIVPTGTVTGGGIIVGYTYKPGTWSSGASADAIVYRHDFLSGSDARSLSHEIGHWFNLAHTFGNTNNPGVNCGSLSGGDGVSDTPDTKGNFSSCPASSTNSAIVCTSGQPVYYQNVENIMDYSNCPKNFTQGQTTKMQTALLSSTSGRNNLSSGSNLIATDVNSALPCSPIADYLSTTNAYTVCSGGYLTMKNYSFNGIVTNFQWAANNAAAITAPNNSITTIVFNTIGTTNVSLTVSNAQGSSTKVRSVTVLNGMASINGPYSESFENSGIPQDWAVINNTPNTITWAQTNASAFDGANCFYIDGSINQANEIDILQTPIINVQNNPNDSLVFSYAYARKSATQNDILKIQGSTNCGATWNDIVTFSAAQMASGSGGTSATPFFPLDLSEWKTYNVSAHPYWTNYLNSQSVLIRFNFQEGTIGGGNNIFIDAVNFGAEALGMSELFKNMSFELFPNPSNSEVNIKFNLNKESTVKINILDVLGKNCVTEMNSNFSVGPHALIINKDKNLQKGIYFVTISFAGEKIIKKLIIN